MTYDPTDTNENDNTADGDVEFAAVNTDEATINHVAGQMTITAGNSISSGTISKVPLDESDIEDSQVVSVDTTNNQISVDVAGKYLISGTVRWIVGTNFDTGERVSSLIKINGSIDDRGNNRRGARGDGSRDTVNTSPFVADLSANDTITLNARQDTGASQDLDGNSTHLTVTRMG